MIVVMPIYYKKFMQNFVYEVHLIWTSKQKNSNVEGLIYIGPVPASMAVSGRRGGGSNCGTVREAARRRSICIHEETRWNEFVLCFHVWVVIALHEGNVGKLWWFQRCGDSSWCWWQFWCESQHDYEQISKHTQRHQFWSSRYDLFCPSISR